ncbi:hypothetical protein L9F63_025004, partial [Diploptera punctata]
RLIPQHNKDEIAAAFRTHSIKNPRSRKQSVAANIATSRDEILRLKCFQVYGFHIGEFFKVNDISNLPLPKNASLNRISDHIIPRHSYDRCRSGYGGRFN